MPEADLQERHNRQMRLQNWGKEGQRAIEKARVLVVGCGGLGAPVIQYLAGAGVGAITLMDDDRVELSNLNRQLLHREADINRLKSERAKEWITALDPSIEVRALSSRLTPENGRETVQNFDMVFDCTDGFASKFLLNDCCVLEQVPLIHGAVSGYAGQWMIINAGGQPCVRCLFETIPQQRQGESCQEMGVLGAACGVIGSSMALHGLLLMATGTSDLVGYFNTCDLSAGAQRNIKISQHIDCSACGQDPEIDGRDPEDYRPI